MKWKWLHSSLLLLALLPVTLRAQQPDSVADALTGQLADPVVSNRQPCQNVQMLAIGSVNLLDTYLSQEKYSGTEVRYISQRLRRWQKHPSWRTALTSSGSFQYASPRADNSNYMGALYTCAFAMRHEWTFGNRWSAEAGAQAEVAGGFLYSTRNSNNPAQARLYLNLGPSAAVTGSFQLLRRILQMRYEAYAPLAGLLFSPNYGQSYYEIFTRGNYDHNVAAASVFSAPTLRHQLTVDYPLRRFSIRVGYLGDFEQAEVNNLKYHTYSHLLLIGIVKQL